jgi:hypothetical protein
MLDKRKNALHDVADREEERRRWNGSQRCDFFPPAEDASCTAS